MKTSELIGPALDWAVAKCEGFTPHAAASIVIMESYRPSTDWAQAGRIIEQEKIGLTYSTRNMNCVSGEVFPRWIADTVTQMVAGPTPLIAAMRCYVASKLGDEVEVPEEMK